MEKHIEKASHLIEALPYIRKFNAKTFVIKCGGAAMNGQEQIKHIMRDIALLHFCGIRLVIVHGGGSEISEMCSRLRIPTKFINGQRVTDNATMEVVQMVLIGKTNKEVVTALNQFGAKAVGLSGQDASFLQVEKLGDEETDLGYVGHVTNVDDKLIGALIAGNFLPVIAPIGVDTSGQAYNINADIVAGAIASTLKAAKLIFLSDVDGVYSDINNPTTQLSTITKDMVLNWLQTKKVTSGMIPKLQSCLQALEQGVTSVHILNGRKPHSLLLEIFTDKGVGTIITN